MSMRDWLWKVADTIAVTLVVVIILMPWSVLGDFLSSLYDANPIYCIAPLVAIGVFLSVTLIHSEVERRRKKAIKDKAASSGGAL